MFPFLFGDDNRFFDASEDIFRQKYPEVIESLLRDHTTQRNIFWATNDYSDLGSGFSFHDEITVQSITGKNKHVVLPRVRKDRALQTSRIRDMAEVFTPLWICNAQNNLIDNAWFNRKNVFNSEITNRDNSHSWQVTPEKILFTSEKTWQEYVCSPRMEITCGEAPYITSRYDTTTGEFIPVQNRIGLLDRKLRVVNENVNDSRQWLKMTQKAYMSIYGYEWQGDNLLIARESMLYTFIENYYMKFKKIPQEKSMNYIAYIISWNVFQMDGLKFVIPQSCHDEEVLQQSFFTPNETKACDGCLTGDFTRHNGIYCLIKDWSKTDPDTKKRGLKIKFSDVMDKEV